MRRGGMRGDTDRQGPALLSSLLAAALLLPCGALWGGCHGRPLLSQMAPGSDPRGADNPAVDRRLERRKRRARLARADLDRYSRARDLFEGRAPMTPVENVLRPEHYRKLVEDQIRRDPRSSDPRTSETLVREQVDELMENPAKPSFMDPGKAYVPGQVCLDPIAISWLIVRYMRAQQGRR